MLGAVVPYIHFIVLHKKYRFHFLMMKYPWKFHAGTFAFKKNVCFINAKMSEYHGKDTCNNALQVFSFVKAENVMLQMPKFSVPFWNRYSKFHVVKFAVTKTRHDGTIFSVSQRGDPERMRLANIPGTHESGKRSLDGALHVHFFHVYAALEHTVVP